MGKLLIFLLSFHVYAHDRCPEFLVSPRPEENLRELAQAITLKPQVSNVDHALATCFRKVSEIVNPEDMNFSKNFLYFHYTNDLYVVPADTKKTCTVTFDPKEGCRTSRAKNQFDIINKIQTAFLSEGIEGCRNFAVASSCQFIRPEGSPIAKEVTENHLADRIEIAIGDMFKRRSKSSLSPAQVLCNCEEVKQERIQLLVRKVQQTSPPVKCNPPNARLPN